MRRRFHQAQAPGLKQVLALRLRALPMPPAATRDPLAQMHAHQPQVARHQRPPLRT
ncbi:MAG: hypothetical protein AMXMBFR83_15460 [Phycisphaerae bacterium]